MTTSYSRCPANGGMVSPPQWGDGGRAGRPTGRARRPVTGFTAKARRQMRWVWNALAWDELDRLTMITLTYPADWRRWCPNGPTLKRHLRGVP
jgi:hypothetical protein